MVITIPKPEYIRFQAGESVLIVNAPEGLKANAVVRTATALPLDDNTDIVRGAGEYEVGGIVIMGFQLKKESQDDLLKTGYACEMEGINIGLFQELATDLDVDLLDKFGSIDILCCSVGEKHLPSKQAITFIKQIDPKVVIFIGESEKDAQELVTEMGQKLVVVPKFVTKQKELEAQEGMQLLWITEK
jgi:L-ascorbate metabolism protein UlaG (beta-lactamase superfamily)